MRWQYKLVIALCVVFVIFIVGFIIGKKSVKVTEKVVTQYIPGESVKDTIYVPQPVKVERPADTIDIIKACIESGIYTDLFPIIIDKDTVYLTKPDTTDILKDWATKRYYSNLLFDNDSIGKLIVNTNIQFNRVASIDYQFDPMIRKEETTKVIQPKFEPFLGAGFGTANIATIQIGTFFSGHYGISYQYQRLFDQKLNNHSIQFIYKF